MFVSPFLYCETVITDQPTTGTVPAESNIMLILFYSLLGNIFINIYMDMEILVLFCYVQGVDLPADRSLRRYAGQFHP
jgi:hypothetical protein